jgi:hypothetical protein
VWSLTVLHRHALYDDYRVTEGCWVACESQVPAGGVDRMGEECVVVIEKTTEAGNLSGQTNPRILSPPKAGLFYAFLLVTALKKSFEHIGIHHLSKYPA